MTSYNTFFIILLLCIAFPMGLLIILSVLGITPPLEHTPAYNEFYIQDGNTNFMFFDSFTFGINIYTDPCTPISPNTVFRSFVNSKVTCSGAWCIDGLFKCEKTSKGVPKTECYDVEHIIDKNGPEFKYCNKNIAANMVMAWNKWNTQLGFRLDYDSNIHEKELVYGKEMMDSVRKQIQLCNVGCENDWTPLTYNFGVLEINIIIFISSIMLTCCLLHCKKKKKSNDVYNQLQEPMPIV